MSTTNTIFNYALGLGTYVGIAVALAGRNPSLAKQVVTDLYINGALRGARYATRRTVHENLPVEESNHTESTSSGLDTVA